MDFRKIHLAVSWIRLSSTGSCITWRASRSSWGHAFRNYFDKPVINEFIGDGAGKTVKASGSGLRKIQAGRIQYYMVVSILMLVLFAFLYYFLIAGM